MFVLRYHLLLYKQVQESAVGTATSCLSRKMTKYGISKFGRQIVIAEDFDEDLPVLRVSFIFITLIVGAVAFLHACKHFIQLYFIQRRYATVATPSHLPTVATPPLLVSITYLVYLVNIVIHSAHYADNIYRPVDYYEPKWLYDQYLLSTMEITFFINFPITIAGSLSIASLFCYEKGKLIIRKVSCYYMIVFIVGSLLTVLHYRTEPPSTYSAVVNFTIAGEGVVAMTLAAIIAYLFRIANGSASEIAGKEHFQGNDIEEELLLDSEQQNRTGRVSRRSPHRKR